MANDDDILGGLEDLFGDDDLKDAGKNGTSIEETEVVAKTEEPLNEDDITDVPGQLAVDIYETEDKLVIKARTAGVKKSDLDLNISNNVLKIHGIIPNNDDMGVVKWWAQECYWGEFDREIVLPVQVEENEVEAVLRDGVLTVTFMKIVPNEKTKIQVL
jgi:HSP20 family protein